MKKILRMCFVVVLLSLQWVAFGQERTITGKVTDEHNETLPGVAVVADVGGKGTITDANGNFSLTVAPNVTGLTFSFVGFVTQKVSIDNRTVINVSLVPEVFDVQEVVVVGYGSAKKVNLTASQTSITSKEMEKTVNTTFEQAIQGKSAGVYVTQNTGQPGGNMSINIRGVSTINANTQPLYVIDGVQIAGSEVQYGSTSSSNPMSTLNPSDIEDVQVLQGPSATAMYGARATNGVVLITTKRGKEGTANFSYNYMYSLQTPPEHIDMMNLPQYAQMVKNVHEVLGGDTPEEFLDPSILGNGTDWQEEMFRYTGMKKHQLSLNGGNEQVKYYLSGEYLDQDGVALGSGFKRYGFRVNTDINARKWLKISENASYSQVNEVLTASSEEVINNAIRQTPQIPVKNIDGTWGGGDEVNGANQFAPVNPVAIAQMRTNNNLRRELSGGVTATAHILDGLDFSTSLNGNIRTQNAIYFNPKMKIGWYENASATMNDFSSVNTFYSWNQQLTYSKSFDNHYLGLTAVHESQEYTWKNNGQFIQGFITNDIIDVEAGDAETAEISGGHGSGAMESYIGRVNYNFSEKYLVEGTIRRDGSSNFGSDKQWGVFPAGSVGWRISKESWFNVPVINELKIRLESGLTGNPGWSAGIYSPMNNNPTEWGSGFLPSRYPNPGLQWEETKTNGIGFNMGLLKNRIQIEGDFFVRQTDNLLTDLPLPGIFGTKGNGGPSSPMVNLGSMENKGWGFTIISTNIKTSSFKWESNFNISGVDTKITSLPNENGFYDRSSWWMNNWTQRAAVGQAPWLFMGYKYDGLFQSVDEINNSPVPADNNGVRRPTDPDNIWVGDVKYKNIKGADGAEGVIDVNDLTYIGNPWPKFYGGFTNTLTWKNFDMNVVFTYSVGNDIYNYTKMVNSNPGQINLSQNLLANASNYAVPVVDIEGNVYLENPGTNLPRLSYGPNGNWERFSSRWVEDGSYIKLRTLSLGYNVPNSLLKKQGIVKDLRLQVVASNLLTFTKYSGYDPEVGSYVGNNASSANQAVGIDYGRYPSTPMYSFNILLNF